MTPTFAHDIIEQLALGLDPASGTPVDNSVLQDPTVIRALFMAKAALVTAMAAGSRKAPGAARSMNKSASKSANAGKKWELGEKQTLRDLHLGGTAIRQIAVQLGRSDGGIIGQLVKDGLVKDRDEGYALFKQQGTAVESEQGRA